MKFHYTSRRFTVLSLGRWIPRTHISMSSVRREQAINFGGNHGCIVWPSRIMSPKQGLHYKAGVFLAEDKNLYVPGMPFGPPGFGN